jgi:glyoxylase-like metal-dependent hydrolase (beta-lactamase superfamily II)
MNIHYLNCGTMHPHIAPLLVPHLDRVPCLCLLIEAGDGLVLVDTGFGTLDMADTSRLGAGNILLNTRPDAEQPAIRQIERLGFRPEDVRDIICTHLDRDHAGGLCDFPHARVHVSLVERDAALSPRDARERERYRPCHFAHGPKWVTYEKTSGESWYGMECIRELDGLPPGIILVPLNGHTRGHVGVAVDTGEGWILHCGDAYYVKEELRADGRGPIGVAGFRFMAHCDHAQAMGQVKRLKGLLEADHGDIFAIAAHDQFEYRNLFGRPLD